MTNPRSATGRLVLTGGIVVTMNPRGEIISPGAVVVDGGQITAVSAVDAVETETGDEIVDCSGQIVMPGLINAHTHAAMALFRGVAEDRSRESWGTTYALPYMERATHDDYYWGAMLGGLEMLANGVTCIADRLSGMGTIAPAYEKIGIRAVLCHTLWDIGQPLEWTAVLDLMQRWGTDSAARVHCGIGPHAPNTCSDDLLRRARALADETGARLFLHCAQSPAEVTAVRARGYRGSVDCLAANGVLGSDVVLAHCIYIDEREIGMLADSGTWVAHCPASNAKVEARMAQVAALLNAGVRIAVATDWAPTNNGMDLFDEMKSAGLLNKVAAEDPGFLPVDALVRMVTIDAARALGLDAIVGSLEPGKRADVITIAMDGLHLQPWQNIPATLVYSAKGLDVRHVWVDGECLLRDRRPLRADPMEVRQQVARIWHGFRQPSDASGARK